jgi:hypothetical protein
MCHKGTKLSAQFPSHNMPTRSCSADLTKSCCYKRLDVSHKTIAGRAWINGIRFDNGRSTLLGVLHRCFDDLFRQSLSTQLSTNKKADQRPYDVLQRRSDRQGHGMLASGRSSTMQRAHLRNSRATRLACHRRHTAVLQLPIRALSGFALALHTMHQQFFGPPRLSNKRSKSPQRAAATS